MLPEYVLPHHTPPPPRPATLTVNSKGWAYPSKALLSRLGLRTDQAIDLLPPGEERTAWQLDLRPTAPLRIKWYADTSPRFTGVRLPAGLLPPGTSLTLVLSSPAQPGHSSYALAVLRSTAGA